jgi:hypothetical protein
MTTMERTCPVCGAENEAAAETCVACGEPLSTVGRIFGHAADPMQPVWLEQARGRAPELKQVGQAGSEARMEGLLDVDRRREAWQSERASQQHRRDRRVLTFALVGSGLFLLVVLAVSLSALLR